MTREEMMVVLYDYCDHRPHTVESCLSCPIRKPLSNGGDCQTFPSRSDEELAMCIDIITGNSAEIEDNVHPKHYQLPGGMQVVDIEQAVFGRAALMEHCLCSATEYILRHKRKNGLEDIRKAHWWIGKYLELAEIGDKEGTK